MGGAARAQKVTVGAWGLVLLLGCGGAAASPSAGHSRGTTGSGDSSQRPTHAGYEMAVRYRVDRRGELQHETLLSPHPH